MSDGKAISGTLLATDENALRMELRKRNLLLLTAREKKSLSSTGFGIFGPPKPHVKPSDVAVVTRQIATMISAGIPLLECLEIVEEQAEDKGFKIALGKMVEDIRGGADFSRAISKYPKIFSKIYVNMVKAAEASGQLDTILNRLAEYLEATEALKREIKSAMTYPVLSLFLILSITAGLLIFVIPQFRSIFEQLGQKDMPLPTEILIAVSNFVRGNILYIIIALVLVLIALSYYKKTRLGEKHWHWFLFHLPIFGALFKKVALSRFSRTFATLLGSGVPMVASLEIVAGTSGNRFIEEAVLSAKESVVKGEALADPLAKTKMFPPMVTRMIEIGEKSGALEKLLSKVSDFYDQEVRTTVKALTSLIEPILILIMGVLVGGIVLAIFLPIIRIQQILSTHK